ncbi:FAD-dependent oxidoreductase [Falsirhodobacter halotolerans]|uniref:FAD-dependent oxidoreductase n=1 Tax=Falsirhodobacter halotolerans TaxID=1146892 RepID=UPI001FD396E5|nr:FAD-dependent oxidoreductase [Falsirhodobacter halotolerans]MCJ8139239.1 FAD-dependent oxidoreductase [Falsirhodobacter halotolerans]
MTRHATIVGAGVAGLATACALARRGWSVDVLEQAPALTQVGAGLQIAPNGLRVLDALGLDVDHLPQGRAVTLRDGPSGRAVLRMALGARAWRMTHRADLIDILAAGAEAAGARLHLGRTATVAQGITIAADGLHSRFRSGLNGPDAPTFSGHVAWRATIPGDDGPPEAEVFMGPGRHLVTYPLRGGALRNIVAVEERGTWAAESWSARDASGDLQRAFAGFCPRVRAWLDPVAEPYLWGLFLHPVAARWHGDGVFLAGDAAHPTLPFMAQGANMALEDAWVLAACLDGLPPDRAGGTYQALRAQRCRRIVAVAAANARNYHLGGAMRLAAQAALRLAGRIAPEAPLRRYDWIYDYDAVQAASSIQTGT